MEILIALLPPISAQRDVEKDAQQWYEKVKGSQGTVNPFGTDKTGNKTERQ